MRSIVLSLVLTVGTLGAMAQDLGKAELKQLKSEIKALSPEEWKSIKDQLATADAAITEKDELDQKVTELQSDLATAESEKDKAVSEKATLETKVAELEKEVADLNSTTTSTATTTTATTTTQEKNNSTYTNYESSNAKGIVYKVQIGSYKGYDLKKYIGKHKNFSGEVGADGSMKYTLGEFKEYWEADALKKYLRNMGVKGAWVVAYKNGKRVDIKDALEGAL